LLELDDKSMISKHFLCTLCDCVSNVIEGNQMGATLLKEFGVFDRIDELIRSHAFEDEEVMQHFSSVITLMVCF
jgi:hypothetical protein